jgi:hypothetical protein
MKDLQYLLRICSQYKNSEIIFDEFQEMVETCPMPSVCSGKFGSEIDMYAQQLESIMYMESGENQRKMALDVVDDIIQAVEAEKMRLEEYNPYHVD